MTATDKQLAIDNVRAVVRQPLKVELPDAIGLTHDEAIVLLAGIVQGFAINCLSGDIQWLAVNHGSRLAKEAGIDEKRVETAIKRLRKHLEKTRKGNPISEMF